MLKTICLIAFSGLLSLSASADGPRPTPENEAGRNYLSIDNISSLIGYRPTTLPSVTSASELQARLIPEPLDKGRPHAMECHSMAYVWGNQLESQLGIRVFKLYLHWSSAYQRRASFRWHYHTVLATYVGNEPYVLDAYQGYAPMKLSEWARKNIDPAFSETETCVILNDLKFDKKTGALQIDPVAGCSIVVAPAYEHHPLDFESSVARGRTADHYNLRLLMRYHSRIKRLHGEQEKWESEQAKTQRALAEESAAL